MHTATLPTHTRWLVAQLFPQQLETCRCVGLEWWPYPPKLELTTQPKPAIARTYYTYYTYNTNYTYNKACRCAGLRW